MVLLVDNATKEIAGIFEIPARILLAKEKRRALAEMIAVYMDGVSISRYAVFDLSAPRLGVTLEYVAPRENVELKAEIAAIQAASEKG